METEFQTKVKIIRSDNGAKFAMIYFFSNQGIIHHKNCVESPQQNGVLKRKHQHILNVAQALQFHLAFHFLFGMILCSLPLTLSTAPLLLLFKETHHIIYFFNKNPPILICASLDASVMHQPLSNTATNLIPTPNNASSLDILLESKVTSYLI